MRDFVAIRRPTLIILIFGADCRLWVAAGLFRLPEAIFRPQERLRPLRGQPVAVLVEVDQREGCTQPLVILADAAITNPGKSEDTLQDAKRIPHPGSHAGLGSVLALGLFLDEGAWRIVASQTACGMVPVVMRMPFDSR